MSDEQNMRKQLRIMMDNNKRPIIISDDIAKKCSANVPKIQQRLREFGYGEYVDRTERAKNKQR